MPVTSANFLDLVKDKFYENLHIHRIIENFMIQFGCPFSKKWKAKKMGTGAPEDFTKFTCKDGTVVTRNHAGCIRDEFVCKISNMKN